MKKRKKKLLYAWSLSITNSYNSLILVCVCPWYYPCKFSDSIYHTYINIYDKEAIQDVCKTIGSTKEKKKEIKRGMIASLSLSLLRANMRATLIKAFIVASVYIERERGGAKTLRATIKH